jgi:DNA-binding XRE family transcriptional regulator
VGRISPLAGHHEQMLRWNAQGLERQEIAQKLGVSKHTVQAYLQRRGIRPVTMRGKALLPQADRVRHMVEVLRMTQAQIAAELGVHLTTVERLCASLGLQTMRTGPRAAHGHCQRWAGGRMLEKHWYIAVFVPLHPYARRTGYVAEHRLVAEVMLGRYLDESEVVDHIDSHTQHNWPANLRVFPKNADHLKATLTGREKYSRVRSIFGDWTSNRQSDPVPSLNETLAQCPSQTRLAVEHHIRIHQPTNEHAHLSRRKLWRSGPWLLPFQQRTTD